MKKMKKILPVILTLSLLVGLLSGCAKKNDGTNNEPTPTTAASEVSGAPQDGANWEGETSHIIVTYLTVNSEPIDLKKVEAAVNEMTIPKIGVEVEFKTISIFEALTQYSMWIASGEPMDVAIVAFTDLASYANQGMLLPLEKLIPKNAPYIEQLGKELPIYDATVIKGSTYGIRVVPTFFGETGSFSIRKTVLDAAGLNYENDTKVTMEELGEIFAKIKKVKPDMYPCGAFGLAPNFGYTTIVDALGTTVSSGVLIGTDSTKVVNMYESDEYYNYLKFMRDWYLKGYIPKDAATAEVNIDELTNAGIISGAFWTSGPQAANQQKTLPKDKECIQLNLTDPYVKSTSSASNTYFTLPVTCTNPEASLRFINMLDENTELANLIQFGFEGEHYVMVDPKLGFINDPEGIDYKDTAYYNPLPFWGDQRKVYKRYGGSTPEELKVYTDRALANPTKGVGFCYDPSAMTSQIIAVDAVVNEYRGALETGSAELDKTYKEFIAKLKANGVDDIIADKQAQFDAWLAQQ